ncbi:MAG: hypothetical protein DI537_05325 [Stutzerimonas stutzeri]|nr:MAG: hypothetical protein DI537_05325 [Stutzerimonas stutzeri]
MSDNKVAAAVAKFRATISEQNSRSTLFNIARGSIRTLFLSADATEVRTGFASGKSLRVCSGLLAAAPGDQSQFDLIVSLDDQMILEHGMSSLYCGLGLLEWADTPTSKPKTAPLVLVPLTAERDADGGFEVRQAGEPVLNEPLLTRLGLDKSSIPADDPLAYRPKKSHTRVRAFTPHAAIGLFSTVRTMLAERLDAAFSGTFASHPLISNLLQTRGGPALKPAAGEGAEAPQPLLPCDTDQFKALALALAGQSALIYGPPGTGKTQTITNIIAAATAREKRVLLLSEAASALKPVVERLSASGFALPILDLSADASTGLRGNHGRMAQLRDELNAIPSDARPSVTICTSVGYLATVPPHWTFDIVIVDEASKMRMSYALPALASSQQAIIVGDNQQCAPSTILQFSQDGSVIFDGDMSLLDAARQANFDAVKLTRHYRSRHPSLIDFSNERFYMNRLIAAPSVHPRGPHGCILHQVNGSFDGGANLPEVDALVARVIQTLSDEPASSVAVIAATYQQCLAIAGRLMTADPAHRNRASILHAASCQGLEFDIVFVSLTHGSRSNGTQRRNFGIFSDIDGDKVLNVCLTRSRVRTEVFSSIDTSNLNPDARSPIGALADFLTSFHDLDEVETEETPATPLSRALKQHGYGVRMDDHHVLVTLEDRNFAAIQLVGGADPLDEMSERAQLGNSGWPVTTIPASALEHGADALDRAIATVVKDLDKFKSRGIL